MACAPGRFSLAAGLPRLAAMLLQAMHIPWLGPGLVIAFLLLVTLRGTKPEPHKPLQRIVHAPRLERYRGTLPRKHKDLEV